MINFNYVNTLARIRGRPSSIFSISWFNKGRCLIANGMHLKSECNMLMQTCFISHCLAIKQNDNFMLEQIKHHVVKILMYAEHLVVKLKFLSLWDFIRLKHIAKIRIYGL